MALSPGNQKTLVFLHVPRTGGTNFWVSLAANCNQSAAFRMFDIFGSGYAQFGSVSQSQRALDGLLPAIACEPKHRLVHHHDAFGVHRRLWGSGAQYFTLLRDPVSRFISSVRHGHAITVQGLANLAARHHSNDVPPPALSRSRDLEVLMRRQPSLLHALSGPRGLGNYYVRYFFNYFLCDREFALPFDHFPTDQRALHCPAGVRLLAATMRHHFSHIGLCEKLADTFAWLEAEIGSDLSRRDVNRNPNAAGRPALLRGMGYFLKPFFALDYLLLSELGLRTTTRHAANSAATADTTGAHRASA